MATIAAPSAEHAFEDFLQKEENKGLLRFTTAGSVDDGKSTLIGRLLYDSRSVYDDQLESVTKASAGRNAGAIDFSLLTDGLRAEREQGITIDVAYRYFATPQRKFIIADTPGHEQYTRNMVTGASTAELAIVLVDARKGLLPQSRRHAYIASLLGLPHVAIAVNKMDLVGYDQAVFTQIEADFRNFLSRLPAIEPYFIPISALAGDNVVSGSTNMPWFNGPSLLQYLEHVPVGSRALHSSFRFPVQRVVRPNQQFRGYAGTVASGEVRPGDEVVILPSGRRTTVSTISTFDGNLASAQVDQSVTLTLSQEIDITRGDLIVSPGDLPISSNTIEATLVWLNDVPAELEKRYRIKHTTRQDWATLSNIEYRVNINTLEHEPAQTLEMNAIANVQLEIARGLTFDPYTKNRLTGSFILIDSVSNATVAAGLISGAPASARRRGSEKKSLASGPVTLGERVVRQGHTGALINVGQRRELAIRLERSLFDRGCTVFSFESLSDELHQKLVAAGALVLFSGEGQQLSIRTMQGSTDAALDSLPVDDNDALAALEHLLERLQILLSEGFSDSAGI